MDKGYPDRRLPVRVGETELIAKPWEIIVYGVLETHLNATNGEFRANRENGPRLTIKKTEAVAQVT